jgi:hypothetical protein
LIVLMTRHFMPAIESTPLGLLDLLFVLPALITGY